ncbi:hypothetical protein [Oceanicoccus sagamiensis]|uniref:Uncharacterized protein n=1 Tax=Oceanicoccus sagamiensis TaxID=716816 RepID=A0A1X9NGA3_9GAMM|nr:hypothetical protein [Oceanicoccus sagamiensis]ARN74885.1 hypothetical protein BST96_12630 [Oceanicoccus sagamiensis]
MNEEFGGYVVILLLIFCFWWVEPFGFFSSEIDFYPRVCVDDSFSKGECEKWKIEDLIRFKVYEDGQKVIRKGGSSIRSLKDCHVWDKNNWECSTLQVVDGELSGIYLTRYSFITKPEWYVLNFFRKP